MFFNNWKESELSQILNTYLKLNWPKSINQIRKDQSDILTYTNKNNETIDYSDSSIGKALEILLDKWIITHRAFEGENIENRYVEFLLSEAIYDIVK